MNEITVVLLFAAIVLAVFGLTMWRGRGRDAERNSVDETLPRTGDDASDAELREMAFDHAMGKLSDEDYRVLRDRVQRASRVAPQAPAPASVPSSARAGVAIAEPRAPDAVPDPGITDLDAAAEELVRRYRGERSVCAVCGPRPEPRASYCSNCGRYIRPCPGCGRTVEELGSRYCGRCGTALLA